MKRLHLYKIFFVCLLGNFFSCEKVVDLDLNTIEPLLVIDASITASGLQGELGCSVVLTKTQNFDSQDSVEPLTGATITLTDNTTGESEGLFLESRFLFYATPMEIKEGHEYTLRVEYEDKVYEATETVPKPVDIDRLYFLRVNMDSKEDHPWMAPVIVFNDPADVSNYYMNTVYVNGTRMKSIYLADDEYKNGKITEHFLPFDSNDNKDEELKIGDQVTVELESLSQQSYKYFLTMFSVAAGGGVNPISNFSGGVLGCFKAYARTSITTTIADDNIVER